jgi:hypothetical protein
MKRTIVTLLSVGIFLSSASPAFAYVGSYVEKPTRRQVRDEAIMTQRIVPQHGAAIDISQRLRGQAEKDSTGRSLLSGPQSRPVGPERMLSAPAVKPTRRTIRENALPPTVIETGGTYYVRPTRRSIMLDAQYRNYIIPPEPPAPTIQPVQ